MITRFCVLFSNIIVKKLPKSNKSFNYQTKLTFYFITIDESFISNPSKIRHAH